MFDLAKKVALITGASRGLGWSMAQSLAKAGAHVVGLDPVFQYRQYV
jgi:NAD(P)-dependent dehydrogenase (short-subunit alcohol dehydrogenase family)